MDRLTPNRRRERTRRALLEAGVQLFAGRGYHGASLDDIAEAAGYSKGAIYDHFGSKDDFFLAVVEHRGEQWFARFAEAMANPDPSIAGMIERTTQVLFDLLQPDPAATMLDAEAWLLGQRDPVMHAKLADQQRRAVQRVADFIAQAIEGSGLTMQTSAEDQAKLLVATTTGISQFALTDPEAGAEELFPRLLTMLVATIVIPPTDGVT